MDVAKIRKDFKVLQSEPRIVYLDSACQSLRPRQVVEAMDEYYYDYPACSGRSVHRLATQVSFKIDEARESIADFIGAASPSEIVFTKSCTESLNTVAKGLRLKKGDIVVTSDIEHNSNHVPWLDLQRMIGIKRRFSRSKDDGTFDIESFKSVMDRSVKVVSMVHTNNVNGVTVPIKEIAEIAHDNGALMVVDGAQSAPHMKVDMEAMDIDVFCMSMHKMLGPSGMGILYGNEEVLRDLRPLMSGGGSVLETTYDSETSLPPPEKFEAGLLNYAGIIGSGAAIKYLREVGMDEVASHSRKLNERITSGLKDIPEVEILRPYQAEKRGCIFSFNIKGLRSHDVAMLLDEMSRILIRSGNHCAHPYFASRGIDGCARASLYLYNDEKDCDIFVDSVKKVVETFAS
ncbi:MAG: cysteine desulfurase [Methanomassiliicoccales archaeon]|nr:MAG: cysteine desulfurase [Methanomassiliicoccales archaeon]